MQRIRISELSGMKQLLTAILILLASCSTSKTIVYPERKISLSGTDFFKQAAAYTWSQRDSFALEEFKNGNVPDFLKKFTPVKISIHDTANGKLIKAIIYVSPDYFSIGTNDNWCRVPVTPMAAQKIADKLNCFLPTKKIVDEVYNAAKIKLEPVPMFAYRDSSPTMYQHHLIIEGQRKQRKGLIAGIKKDVVITGLINHENKTNRVAIYGWHKTDGKPIQPLYTGHINWYVDYSHGIRFIYRKIRIGHQWMDYTDVLKHALYNKLICDEEYCDFYTYPY
jgi:hypothetical protein